MGPQRRDIAAGLDRDRRVVARVEPTERVVATRRRHQHPRRLRHGVGQPTTTLRQRIEIRRLVAVEPHRHRRAQQVALGVAHAGIAQHLAGRTDDEIAVVGGLEQHRAAVARGRDLVEAQRAPLGAAGAGALGVGLADGADEVAVGIVVVLRAAVEVLQRVGLRRARVADVADAVALGRAVGARLAVDVVAGPGHAAAPLRRARLAARARGAVHVRLARSRRRSDARAAVDAVEQAVLVEVVVLAQAHRPGGTVGEHALARVADHVDVVVALAQHRALRRLRRARVPRRIRVVVAAVGHADAVVAGVADAVAVAILLRGVVVHAHAELDRVVEVVLLDRAAAHVAVVADAVVVGVALVAQARHHRAQIDHVTDAVRVGVGLVGVGHVVGVVAAAGDPIVIGILLALGRVDGEVVAVVAAVVRGAAEHQRHAARVPERGRVGLGVGHLRDVVEPRRAQAVAVLGPQHRVEAHRVDRDRDLADRVAGHIDGQARRAAGIGLERRGIVVTVRATGDRDHAAVATGQRRRGGRVGVRGQLVDRELAQVGRRQIDLVGEAQRELVARADAEVVGREAAVRYDVELRGLELVRRAAAEVVADLVDHVLALGREHHGVTLARAQRAIEVLERLDERAVVGAPAVVAVARGDHRAVLGALFDPCARQVADVGGPPLEALDRGVVDHAAGAIDERDCILAAALGQQRAVVAGAQRRDGVGALG